MTKEEIRSRKKDFSHVELQDMELSGVRILFSFIPMKSEVDVTPLNEKASKLGITVAFPMEEPGHYKDWKTEKEITVSTVSEPAVMLVPGVAFSKDGKRVGRGRGWYDRTIAHCGSNIETVGVCKKSQVLDTVPTDEFDKKVSRLLVL